MEFTAKQIADFIGGRVEGDDNATVHTFSKIEEGTKGSITFLSNPIHTVYLRHQGKYCSCQQRFGTGPPCRSHTHPCGKCL